VAQSESVKIPTESLDKARNYATSQSPSPSLTQVMVAAIDLLVDSSKMIFKSGDKIKHEGKKYGWVENYF
jgi:hypothetical protein